MQRLPPPQEPMIITLHVILHAGQAWAYARWLRSLTLDDYLAKAIDAEQALAMRAAGQAILDELGMAGVRPR
jgi:hypothetical protein